MNSKLSPEEIKARYTELTVRASEAQQRHLNEKTAASWKAYLIADEEAQPYRVLMGQMMMQEQIDMSADESTDDIGTMTDDTVAASADDVTAAIDAVIDNPAFAGEYAAKQEALEIGGTVEVVFPHSQSHGHVGTLTDIYDLGGAYMNHIVVFAEEIAPFGKVWNFKPEHLRKLDAPPPDPLAAAGDAFRQRILTGEHRQLDEAGAVRDELARERAAHGETTTQWVEEVAEKDAEIARLQEAVEHLASALDITRKQSAIFRALLQEVYDNRPRDLSILPPQSRKLVEDIGRDLGY